jgi:hypothetical protein
MTKPYPCHEKSIGRHGGRRSWPTGVRSGRPPPTCPPGGDHLHRRKGSVRDNRPAYHDAAGLGQPARAEAHRRAGTAISRASSLSASPIGGRLRSLPMRTWDRPFSGCHNLTLGVGVSLILRSGSGRVIDFHADPVSIRVERRCSSPIKRSNLVDQTAVSYGPL